MAKKKDQKKDQQSYDADSIDVLEGLEPVRKRPAMYIDDTEDAGLHRLVWEVVDNGIDEALAGHCDKIVVEVDKEGFVSVTDNGRGIPVGPHPHPRFKDKTALEVILETLHAGGKFDKGVYAVSGGLHGVGVSCVNALSEHLEAHVWREGRHYEVAYSKGEIASPMKECDTHFKPPKGGTGTLIIFKPDEDVFGVRDFNETTIAKRLEELSYLNPGLNLIFKYKGGKNKKYQHRGGLIEYVTKLNARRTPLHDKPFSYSGEKEDVIVDFAVQYTTSDSEKLLAFVNNIFTFEGGTHLAGFRSALTRTMNNYVEKKQLMKDKDGTLTGEDIREGLTCVLSLKHPDPQFTGQTKSKLANQEVRKIVESVIAEKVMEWLMENPKDAKSIVQKCIVSKKAREAAKRARERERGKGLLAGGHLQGVLTPCTSRDSKECEIFIVEGQSAGGSAKGGRDRKRQAILPLRGKVLNVEKVDLERMLKNKEINNLISALGVGIETFGDFDYKKLKYHKVIIMTDADDDGAHIAILLLTFFFRHLRTLIQKGHVYMACPPLYRVQKGKVVVYVQDDDEKDRVIQSLAKRSGNVKLQRYKGLGEMDAKQLWETTMDPNSRTLRRIRIEDEAACEKAFETLMGNNPLLRKEFIYQNALDAQFDV
jgi:DNA gyrase subunit B